MSARPEPGGYRFEDRSLLRPPFVRVYVSRLFRLVPRWLTANFVTLAAFGATCVMLAFAAWADRFSAGVLALVYALTLQLYVAGDHLDGMQAVASRTTSPLGEFLDHFLDALSGAIVVLAGFTLMPGAPGWAFYTVLVLYLMAFTVTYAERAERRTLVFARVGALEGIVVVTVFFLTSAVAPGRALWTAPVVGALPAWWLLVALAWLVLGGTVALILRRIGGVPGHFGLYTALAVAAAWGLAVDGGSLVPRTAGWTVVALHGAHYLALVMQPRVFGRRLRPDMVAPAVVVVAVAGVAAGIVDPAGARALLLGAAAYLAVRVGLAVARVVRRHHDHWVWVNPRPEETAGD